MMVCWLEWQLNHPQNGWLQGGAYCSSFPREKNEKSRMLPYTPEGQGNRMFNLQQFIVLIGFTVFKANLHPSHHSFTSLSCSLCHPKTLWLHDWNASCYCAVCTLKRECQWSRATIEALPSISGSGFECIWMWRKMFIFLNVRYCRVYSLLLVPKFYKGPGYCIFPSHYHYTGLLFPSTYIISSLWLKNNVLHPTKRYHAQAERFILFFKSTSVTQPT